MTAQRERRELERRYREFLASLRPGATFTVDDMLTWMYPDMDEREVRELALSIEQGADRLLAQEEP